MNHGRLASFAACAWLAATGAPANSWQDLARQDLAYIRQMVLENHPGVVDPDNPGFKASLEQNYRNVIAQLRYVQSLDAVMNLDNEFVASFADVHFEIHFRVKPVVVRWNGMLIERRAAKYLVTKVESTWAEPLPVIGAELLSCDGKAVGEIMNTEVLRYRFADYAAEFPRVGFASALLTDDGVGYRTHPAQCRFRDVEGHEADFSMRWKMTESLGAGWNTSRKPEGGQFRLEQLPGAVTWVSVPSLPFTRGPELQQVAALTESLASLHKDRDSTVVFDLRGNGGGDSLVGLKLLTAAVHDSSTTALVRRVPQLATMQARFRASQDNLEQIRRLMADEHREAAVVASRQELAANMAQDLAVHRDLTPQPNIARPTAFVVTVDSGDSEPRTHDPPRILVLTDHFCASACLDFLMEALTIPTAVHVGQLTSADSAYNEPLRFLNPFELPSKLGVFHMPSKIAGARGPFTPAERFDGDMRDTEAVKAWVLKLPQLQRRATN